MDEFVDLSRVALETNSPLWQIGESEGEPILSEGRLGFYIGTATDTAFRRIMIEDLP